MRVKIKTILLTAFFVLVLLGVCLYANKAEPQTKIKGWQIANGAISTRRKNCFSMEEQTSQ